MQTGNYDNERSVDRDAVSARNLSADRETHAAGACGAIGVIGKVSQPESSLAYEIGDFRKGFVIRSL